MKLRYILLEDERLKVDSVWGTGKGGLKTVVYYLIVPGYQSSRVEDTSHPDAVCRLSLGQIDDDYFYVDMVHTDELVRNRGYATKLYRYALGDIKKLGFRGIRSSHCSRNRNSDGIWSKLGGYSDENYNYLE